MGFEKALGEVKVIVDQIQYRSQSLLNLARGYFSIVVSTFTAWFPIESAVSGFKGEQRP